MREQRVEGAKIKDILCFVSKDKGVTAFFCTGLTQSMNNSLIQLSGILPKGSFTRIHRSYLIKSELMIKLQRKEQGSGWEVVAKGVKNPIPVGRNRVAVVREIVATNHAYENNK